MSKERMSSQEVERICEDKGPHGRLCLQPPGHKSDHRNGEHTWANDRGPVEPITGDSGVPIEPLMADSPLLAEAIRSDSELATEALTEDSRLAAEQLTEDSPLPGERANDESRLGLQPVTGDSPVPRDRFTVPSRAPAEPWVTVGFVAEPGDPQDTYRISVTCQGVTHYIGVLIEGWEVADVEARALANVLGPVATIGPKWSDAQREEVEPVDGTLLKVYQEAVRFLRDLPDIPEVGASKALGDALDAFEVVHSDLADSVWLRNFKPSGQKPVAWKEKFFWADCTLDGLYGLVEECCQEIKNTPEGEGERHLLDLVLLKLHNGLAEVEREYTNKDASAQPPRRDHRESLAEALYDSWCQGVEVGMGCFSPYGWEDLKLMAEPDHRPRPEQFYEKADAILTQGKINHGDIS